MLTVEDSAARVVTYRLLGEAGNATHPCEPAAAARCNVTLELVAAGVHILEIFADGSAVSAPGPAKMRKRFGHGYAGSVIGVMMGLAHNMRPYHFRALPSPSVANAPQVSSKMRAEAAEPGCGPTSEWASDATPTRRARQIHSSPTLLLVLPRQCAGAPSATPHACM